MSAAGLARPALRDEPAAASGAAPVLIVGAGPAGLAVAACLGRAGVAVDLVDRAGTPGGAFRPIRVHA